MLKTNKTYLALVIIVLFGFWLLKPSEESATEDDFSHLVRINPIPEAQQLVQQEKFAEADNYLSYFMDYDYVNQDPQAIQIYNKIQDTRDDWLYKLKKVNSGFWSGESDETEGQVAAVVSDFLVIGDIRDLGREGKNFIQGKDIDEVSVALSAVGVVAASAALITAGTAATAKPAVSFLKMANKAGKMPKWLGKSLVESAEIAKKTRSLDHVTGIFSDIHGLYKTAGARSTLELLGKSNNLDDFRRLAKFGSTFGAKTSTLLKIVGDDAVTAYQRLGNTPKNTFLEATTFGRDGIKALEESGIEKFQSFLDYEKSIKGASGLRNGHLAGKVHPKTGISFDKAGYPDFSKVAKTEVKITQTGTRLGDFRAANESAGLKSTPEGYTWHHHQDGTTMQLVPRDIHVQTGHTGGFQPGL